VLNSQPLIQAQTLENRDFTTGKLGDNREIP